MEVCEIVEREQEALEAATRVKRLLSLDYGELELLYTSNVLDLVETEEVMRLHGGTPEEQQALVRFREIMRMIERVKSWTVPPVSEVDDDDDCMIIEEDIIILD